MTIANAIRRMEQLSRVLRMMQAQMGPGMKLEDWPMWRTNVNIAVSDSCYVLTYLRRVQAIDK